VVFVFIFANIYSQNIDSLFDSYLDFHGVKTKSKHETKLSSQIPSRKCGFGMAEILLENKNKLSSEKQSFLTLLTDRPNTDTFIISPSNKFKLHFYKSGSNSPKYDVHTLAAAFDSAYSFEVNNLGFPSPPTDGTEGGDEKYDVYIQSLGPGSYGETRFIQNSDGKYVSYTLVNNSFSSVPTTGIDGAIVTAAHEFHHAIQVGNYGWFSDQTYFYEITSTSMEEFVFDEINDYYYYLPAYFKRPSNAFTSYTGYELAHWNIYLKEKYEKTENDYQKGFNIIKRSWEVFANSQNGVEAYSLALFENGSSFKKEFLDFGFWCYFTSGRNDANHFKEADNYPKLKPMSVYQFSPPQKQYMFNTSPISNAFIYFTGVPMITDTLVTLISDCDFENSMFPANTMNVNYFLYNYNESGSTKIFNDYYSKYTSSNNKLISEGNVFNNVIVNGNDFEMKAGDFAFPQPFSYSKFDNLYIPAFKTNEKFAEVNIYSIDMNLVFSGELQVQSNDKIFVKWKPRDNFGNKLSSGVYLFVAKTGGKILKGKFVILNDDK